MAITITIRKEISGLDFSMVKKSNK
jgi:hypothetical protein